MRKIVAVASVLLSLSGYGAEIDSIQDMFSKGTIHGNIKYYFIETNKKNSITNLSARAYANSIGGKLNYTTAELNGISVGLSFMTTNPFSLPQRVDTSILARDDGVRLENSAGGDIAQKGFSVLGESFMRYRYENLQAWYGRKLIKTPLIHAKEVRMIPSAVAEGLQFGASYYDKFKQRTYSKFINIIGHALGSDTKEITGKDRGYILPVYVIYKSSKFQFQLYDYYAEDFMNTMYLDAQYKNEVNTDFSYSLAVQGIHQRSIGH